MTWNVGEIDLCAMKWGISVFDWRGIISRTYTMDDSLSSNVCLDLTFDFQGNLWIATDQGLSKMTLGEGFKN